MRQYIANVVVDVVGAAIVVVVAVDIAVDIAAVVADFVVVVVANCSSAVLGDLPYVRPYPQVLETRMTLGPILNGVVPHGLRVLTRLRPVKIR